MRSPRSGGDTAVLKRLCRFFRPGHKGECWEWHGARSDAGYGRFHLHGCNLLAHRVSYELFTGRTANGLCVLHSCDNPACINPAHLRPGTQSDNMNDKKIRKRAIGERSPRRKLTQRDVDAIRELRRRHSPSGGAKTGIDSFLSRWFGVRRSHVSDIGSGRYWS